MKTINFMTPINSLGYGVTGINMLKAFIRQGIDTYLIPIGTPSPEYNDRLLVERNTLGLGKSTFLKDTPILRNYHEFDINFPPSNGLKIVWPFFEVDALGNKATQLLRLCDAVACGSKWIEEVMHNHGITKTFIAPQGVDNSLFTPKPAYKGNKYIFYTVGKFESRKGHAELISAFKKAFPNEKDVELHMCCSNPFLEMRKVSVEKLINQISENDKRIKYIDRLETHADVSEFLSKVNCGVFPTKGEGFGLPILECIASNRPVISTIVTSHADFLNSEVALEINTKGKIPANDNVFFFGRGKWYVIDTDSLVDKLRYAYENKINDNPKGVEMASKFTWDLAAKNIIEKIEELK